MIKDRQPEGKAVIQEKPQVFSIQVSRNHRIIIWLLFLLTAGPILIDLIHGGWQRALSYFASDAFYYFTVARNAVDMGSFTFDTEFPTNGFHPLWQIMLVVLFKVKAVLQLFNPVIFVVIVLLCIMFISLALLIIARSIMKETSFLRNDMHHISAFRFVMDYVSLSGEFVVVKMIKQHEPT